MITLERVCVTLGGRQVLADVNASFAPGRITALLGPNGAGKSTLLKAILGLVDCTGEVSTLALPQPTRARTLGYLAQNAVPSWNLRSDELVMLGRVPHRSPRAAPSAIDHAVVAEALAACDATHFADRPINTLSGGEAARVLLARVLAGEPDWLLIDEPLNHLDPKHQQQLLILLRAQADAGRGVIIVLHDINAAARIADDVLLLRDGRVLAQGKATEVLTPANLTATYDLAFQQLIGDGTSRLFAPLGADGLAADGTQR